MAAGLTIAASDLERFREVFDEVAREQLSKEDLEQRLDTDGVLEATDMTLALAESIREAGPWGHQFPEPLFDGVFRVLQQRIVGQRHLKIVLMELSSGLALDGIQFNTDLAVWPDDSINSVRAVYKLDVNEFRGQQSVQLMIEYLEPVVED
jgi:single-stranded-DNA-specific exonuclease